MGSIEFKLLILIIVVNGIPIILTRLFGRRLAAPLDCGLILSDQHPLLGASKTWRGLMGAILVTPLMAVLLDISALIGLWIAVGAMGGDALSSFIKRRLGKPSGSQALFLDQIPECVLPLLMVNSIFNLSLATIALMTCAFIIFERFISWVLNKLTIRKHPY